MPSSGLWEQAQPGWRSAADMQRVEAWRAETNVRRGGVGSPERRDGQTQVENLCYGRLRLAWAAPSPKRTGKAHRLKTCATSGPEPRERPSPEEQPSLLQRGPETPGQRQRHN